MDLKTIAHLLKAVSSGWQQGYVPAVQYNADQRRQRALTVNDLLGSEFDRDMTMRNFDERALENRARRAEAQRAFDESRRQFEIGQGNWERDFIESYRPKNTNQAMWSYITGGPAFDDIDLGLDPATLGRDAIDAELTYRTNRADYEGSRAGKQSRDDYAKYLNQADKEIRAGIDAIRYKHGAREPLADLKFAGKDQTIADILRQVEHDGPFQWSGAFVQGTPAPESYKDAQMLREMMTPEYRKKTALRLMQEAINAPQLGGDEFSSTFARTSQPQVRNFNSQTVREPEIEPEMEVSPQTTAERAARLWAEENIEDWDNLDGAMQRAIIKGRLRDTGRL